MPLQCTCLHTVWLRQAMRAGHGLLWWWARVQARCGGTMCRARDCLRGRRGGIAMLCARMSPSGQPSAAWHALVCVHEMAGLSTVPLRPLACGAVTAESARLRSAPLPSLATLWLTWQKPQRQLCNLQSCPLYPGELGCIGCLRVYFSVHLQVEPPRILHSARRV